MFIINDQLKTILQKSYFYLPLILYGENYVQIELSAKIFAKKINPIREIDVEVFYPESKSNLYQMNTLNEFIINFNLPPLENKYKIYIFNHVDHMLMIHFNKLLKTLEEKKPFVIILFLTTNINSIPQTVISRCQKIYIHTQEQEIDTTLIVNAIKYVYLQNYRQLFETIKEIEKSGISLISITTTVLNFHRDIYLIKQLVSHDYLNFQQEKDAFIACAQKNIITLDGLLNLINIVNEANERNITMKHLLEYLFLQLGVAQKQLL